MILVIMTMAFLMVASVFATAAPPTAIKGVVSIVPDDVVSTASTAYMTSEAPTSIYFKVCSAAPTIANKASTGEALVTATACSVVACNTIGTKFESNVDLVSTRTARPDGTSAPGGSVIATDCYLTLVGSDFYVDTAAPPSIVIGRSLVRTYSGVTSVSVVIKTMIQSSSILDAKISAYIIATNPVAGHLRI